MRRGFRRSPTSASVEEVAARSLQPLTVGAGSGGDGAGARGPEAAEEGPPVGGDGEGPQGPEAEEEEPAAPLGGGGAAAEEDVSDEEGEEARVPCAARSPLQPTKAEWEAHQATHLPSRNWCRLCVEGRCGTPSPPPSGRG